MPRGNPNPSPATRFKPGTIANPRGKTSEQRAAEMRNAQIATEIRGRMLEQLHARVLDDETGSQAIAAIDADVLRLLKDSEDRGLGTPKASVDISNADGSLQREPIQAEVIKALAKLHDGRSPKRK